jgi:cell division septation protein DedD
MMEVYDESERDPAESRRDTELTLGPMMLLGLFFGLVLLCGLSFGLGYSFGSRGAHALPVSQPTVTQTVDASAGSQSKPAPAPPAVSRPQPATDLSANSETDTSADSQSSASSTQIADSQPVVKPALSAASLPASSTASSLMVQVAAVSHQEDADVLVGALRKRGYSVTASRDIADHLIHVRVGPFTSRGDAESTWQRLHNDGYNAIVQP